MVPEERGLETMDDAHLAREIVNKLMQCGHFLYFRMGGWNGRGRILVGLSLQPVILQKDLQARLQIQSGSLSEAIIRLEAEGLVRRGRSQQDGRQLALSLTKAGEEEAERMKRDFDARVSRMMDCFSTQQLRNLQDLLNTMYDHWSEADFYPEQQNTKER